MKAIYPIFKLILRKLIWAQITYNIANYVQKEKPKPTVLGKLLKTAVKYMKDNTNIIFITSDYDHKSVAISKQECKSLKLSSL